MGGTPERGTSPPEGYDAGAVAAAACDHDPGLPADQAERLARAAGYHLARIGELDAAAVARALLVEDLAGGAASAAAVVGRAAVDFCRRNGVDLRPA